MPQRRPPSPGARKPQEIRICRPDCSECSQVTFSSLSALQKIHAKDAPVFKGDEFYGLLDGGTEGGRSIQMTADNVAHAMRRRVFDKALPSREHTFAVLNDLAKLFTETAMLQAGRAGTKERDGWSAPIDLNVPTSWFSFDLISTIAFGVSLNLLRSEEYRWVPGCLQRASIFLYWGGYAPYLTFWRWFVGTSLPSLFRMRTIQESQKYTEFSDFMLDKRAAKLAAEEREKEAKSTDIFQHLLRSKLYSATDLRADSALLIAAGSDAIRLTLAATVFYWLENPDIFDRAKQEIRSCVASADDITEATLSSMRFLRACIDETMRLCPPKASSLPREVMEGGIVIDGLHVPKGCTVGVSVYALHRDPDIFPEPCRYNPDRWLIEPFDRRMKDAFCPFLKGPRACPGKTVAYFAMQLALFHLVWRFEIRSGEEPSNGTGKNSGHHLRREADQYQFEDWILGYAEGPSIELRERA